MPKSKRLYILWILLTLLILPTHAKKKDYSPGYIINYEGETVEGWVKDRSSGTFIELYSRIRFKPDNAHVKRKYGPDEILGYGFNEMVRVTQGILGLKRNKLIDYFWDCPELVKSLEKKELKEIHEVFNFYTERCTHK